jgi:hypothetical protein
MEKEIEGLAAEAARDWLEENRDAIEAGGDGDIPDLIRRLATIVCPEFRSDQRPSS